MKPRKTRKNLQRKQNLQSAKITDCTEGASAAELFERCVLCGELTPVPVTMPVEFRENYELGCGQLCILCRQKMQQDA